MKLMTLLRIALGLIDRALAFTYSLFFISRFAAWGPRSRLGRGAKLIGPELVCVGSVSRLANRHG